MSIRFRFLLIIGFLSIASVGIIAFFSYKFSLNSATTDAKEKGALVFNLLESSRIHFRDNMKPKIKELLNDTTVSENFPAELVSGFAFTRGVWDTFSKKNKDYIFKMATIDPLVPSNKADKEDLQIIARFKENPSHKTFTGMITKNSKTYYYVAQQIQVKPKCLNCHGDPKKAPAWQRKIYGITNGYNWKNGDIISAHIVYVPFQATVILAQKNSWHLIGIGSCIVFLIMVIIGLSFRYYVLNPLFNLEKRTTEISLGKNLSHSIETGTNDEIGRLAQAIDRLRISVGKMLSKLKI